MSSGVINIGIDYSSRGEQEEAGQCNGKHLVSSHGSLEKGTSALPIAINAPSNLDADLNIHHIELSVHLSYDPDLLSLTIDRETFVLSRDIPLIQKTGLEYPYLLHEVFAFCSCRLAYLKPEKREFYQNQAIQLQTRAVSLFNTTWKGVNESNCVAVTLFSSILGHHLLADTLAKRNSAGLDGLIKDCLQFLEMHRGIRTIVDSAWPQLMNSELEPVLSASVRFTSRLTYGIECSHLRQMVENSEFFSEEDKRDFYFMIHQLQIGFDAAKAEVGRGYRHYMVYTWLLNTPQGFITHFSTKRPEALVLFAYYAVLLHFARDLWQVGDSGVYVLRITEEFLGEKWRPSFEYLWQLINGDLVRSA